MNFYCRLQYNSNRRPKSEEKGCNAVYDQMEVEYYHARMQYLRLAVVLLIRTLSCLCVRNKGERCKRCCRSTTSSSNDTVDKYACLVSKKKSRNNAE